MGSGKRCSEILDFKISRLTQGVAGNIRVRGKPCGRSIGTVSRLTDSCSLGNGLIES
jgi:hypothetical protein